MALFSGDTGEITAEVRSQEPLASNIDNLHKVVYIWTTKGCPTFTSDFKPPNFNPK